MGFCFVCMCAPTAHTTNDYPFISKTFFIKKKKKNLAIFESTSRAYMYQATLLLCNARTKGIEIQKASITIIEQPPKSLKSLEAKQQDTTKNKKTTTKRYLISGRLFRHYDQAKETK